VVVSFFVSCAWAGPSSIRCCLITEPSLLRVGYSLSRLPDQSPVRQPPRSKGLDFGTRIRHLPSCYWGAFYFGHTVAGCYIRRMALGGARAKLARAKEHFTVLEKRIQEFLATDPYRVVITADPAKGIYLVKIHEPKPLPAEEFSVIIGDCVHNMRSALDFVAWELAGSRPKDTQTMFPIFIDPGGFKKSRGRRLGNVSVEAQNVIESMQPYRLSEPKQTALWAIETLDAADKHRLLTVTTAIQDEVEISFVGIPKGTNIPFEMHSFPNIALEHDAVVAEVVLGNPVPALQFRAAIVPAITFGESLGFGLRSFVVQNLKAMLSEVEGIMPRFEGFFGR
jgi:hypothetical protein